MNSEISTIGLVITTMNIAIVVLLAKNIVKCYLWATDISKAHTKADVDFYFLLMLASMIFFVANMIAMYTGIKTYIMHPYTSLDGIVWWRLMDRTGMLATSIVLIWIRRRHNPFK